MLSLVPADSVDEVPRVLDRFRCAQLALLNEQRPAPGLGDAGPAVLPGASADDAALRRGLPMIGRGVSGVITGTQPERALLAAERRRRHPIE